LRALEDELIAERLKVEILEKKNIEYMETINELELAVADLKLMLERAEAELKKRAELEKAKEMYSQCLKDVGDKIGTLNEVLEKKSREYLKLTQSNAKLKEEHSKL
jgi:multidrug resistance efflux pump